MKPFLKQVAEDLYTRFKGNLENVAVVFPNKRAGLFFNQYLLECSGGTPIWSPHYMTISELFEQNSGLVIADSILLVSRLYKEYVRPRREDENESEYEKSVESLDSFYYWGEMLIRDFDDIDKNLADARRLFANIKDLREMGIGKDTLEEEQVEAIGRFFKNFNPDVKSNIKDKFQDIWERLYDIYCNFKKNLRESNVAYEGMLYRDVIEQDGELEFKHDKYVFVGFNALNGAETELFTRLKKQGKGLFYWDYDKFYTDATFHEAGHFMKKNLSKFPNALENETFDRLRGPKNVTVVSAATDSIEARYVSEWLDGHLTKENVETAIVLCDETMLEPVLHTIPEKANGNDLKSMNVTMGYPLSHTPIFSLMKVIVEMHTRGWSEKNNAFSLKYVDKVLKHPYVIQGSEHTVPMLAEFIKNNVFYPTSEQLHKDEFLTSIFTHSTDNSEWIDNLAQTILTVAENRARVAEEKHQMYDLLFNEAIMKVHTQAKRLKTLHSAGELQLKQSTIGRLFIRMLSSMSIPFHGEPVVGLQVMGLLETRNLDFKNVILLSANEGSIPKASNDSSYIPYNLRRAFGLTLSEHRDSIYAYNFYRLLQRAENVTLVYNSSTSGKHRGECSRYILQLLGSNLYDIKKLNLTAKQESSEITLGDVMKTTEMVTRLRERFDTGYNSDAIEMSPSAINRYIRCRLSFFYYYILGLKPLQDTDTELKSTDFGTIFHTAAELLYNELTSNGNRRITRNMLEYYSKNSSLLYRFVDQAFQKEFFKEGKLEYDGEQYINRGVIHNFLLRLVKIDAEYSDFTYIGSEKKVILQRPVKCNGFDVSLNLGGTIDRIDTKGNTVSIVDYKTGSKDEKKTILDDLFTNGVKSAGNKLQILLYCIALDEILKNGSPSADEPSWIKEIRKSGATEISPVLLYMRGNDSKKNAGNKQNKRDTCIVELDGAPITDINTFKDEYLQNIDNVLKEIFDTDVPFTPTADKKNCEFCDYKGICRK